MIDHTPLPKLIKRNNHLLKLNVVAIVGLLPIKFKE
jgi:hypothetical protein